MRVVALALAIVLVPQGLAALAQRPPAAAFAPEAEDPETFPDLPGRDETFGFCAACHGFRLVAAQGMTREQWDGSLTWMTDRHAMPVLEQADRDVILDYLAKAFPPREPAPGRGGWRSPFQPQ